MQETTRPKARGAWTDRSCVVPCSAATRRASHGFLKAAAFPARRKWYQARRRPPSEPQTQARSRSVCGSQPHLHKPQRAEGLQPFEQHQELFWTAMQVANSSCRQSCDASKVLAIGLLPECRTQRDTSGLAGTCRHSLRQPISDSTISMDTVTEPPFPQLLNCRAMQLFRPKMLNGHPVAFCADLGRPTTATNTSDKCPIDGGCQTDRPCGEPKPKEKLRLDSFCLVISKGPKTLVQAQAVRNEAKCSEDPSAAVGCQTESVLRKHAEPRDCL